VFDGINMPGLMFFGACFLCLTFKMTKCNFQTQVTILISDVMETQFFSISNGEVNTISEHNVVLAYRGKECSISAAANG